MVGVMQMISGIFMLWAIFRLYKEIKGQNEFRDLFD